MYLKLYDTKSKQTVWYDIIKKTFENSDAKLQDCLLQDVRMDSGSALYTDNRVAFHHAETNSMVYARKTTNWVDNGRDSDGHFTGYESADYEYYVDYDPNFIIKKFNLKGKYQDEKN